MKLNTVSAYLDRYNISLAGITLGLLFLSASLTPSMIPRSALIQGVLGGLVMAIGYLFTAIMIWMWRFLELPEFKTVYRTALNRIILLIALAVLFISLFTFRDSQNDLRALMTMAPVGAGHEIFVLVIAGGIFCFLLLFARFLVFIFRFIRNRIPGRVPPRVSFLFSFLMVAVVSWNIGNGVIGRGLLNIADETLREVDALIDPDLPIPEDPVRTGSTASLISWDSLGARGRQFIAGGTNTEEIARFHDGIAVKQPIRIKLILQN